MDDPVDPAGDTARVLRLRLLEEFRGEAEAAEADARALALRSRMMSQVAHDCMTSGRHVAITLPTTTITGPVLHARADLAVVRSGPHLLAHVQLPSLIVLRVLAGTSSGRSRDPVAPPSFIAAMRTLEMQRAEVQVLTIAGPTVDGSLLAVTPDHLALDGGAGRGIESMHIPLGGVAAVLVDATRESRQ